MTREFDVVMLGPVAADLVVVGEEEMPTTGGGVWYGAFPLLSMGLKVAVVTRCGSGQAPALAELEAAGAAVFPVRAFETTGIRNVYGDASMETRTCTVLGCAGPLLPEQLPDVDAQVWYGGALFRGEVPLETVRHLAARRPVCIDLQGYLRFRSGNDLLSGPFEPLSELLGLSRYLKADLAEAALATGSSDAEEAARLLAAHGPREVLISGNNALSVLADGELFRHRLTPRSKAGRTGRGDTATATYVGCRLRGLGPDEALCEAARVTSIKMETAGPYRG